MVIFFGSHWKNSFLSKWPTISTFREQLRYFEITLKKSFFAHISETSKLKENILFFGSLWKNYFLSLCPKMSTFRSFFAHICETSKLNENILFLDLFEKIVFYPYVQKYQHFEEITLFWAHFEKSFLAHIFVIQGKILFFRSRWNNSFFLS